MRRARHLSLKCGVIVQSRRRWIRRQVFPTIAGKRLPQILRFRTFTRVFILLIFVLVTARTATFASNINDACVQDLKHMRARLSRIKKQIAEGKRAIGMLAAAKNRDAVLKRVTLAHRMMAMRAAETITAVRLAELKKKCGAKDARHAADQEFAARISGLLGRKVAAQELRSRLSGIVYSAVARRKFSSGDVLAHFCKDIINTAAGGRQDLLLVALSRLRELLPDMLSGESGSLQKIDSVLLALKEVIMRFSSARFAERSTKTIKNAGEEHRSVVEIASDFAIAADIVMNLERLLSQLLATLRKRLTGHVDLARVRLETLPKIFDLGENAVELGDEEEKLTSMAEKFYVNSTAVRTLFMLLTATLILEASSSRYMQRLIAGGDLEAAGEFAGSFQIAGRLMSRQNILDLFARALHGSCGEFMVRLGRIKLWESDEGLAYGPVS